MELKNVIKGRRSVRSYKPDIPKKEKINAILDAACWAPSDGNKQPWKFYVTSGGSKSTIAKAFHEFSKGYIANAPYIPENEKASMLEYTKDFGGAPLVIVTTYTIQQNEDATLNALQGACAATQNMLLAAADEGLGTVWVSHVYDDGSIREALNLPDTEKIASIVPIGYPATEFPETPRESAAGKTTWVQ